MKKNYDDLIGQKFGKLTILEIIVKNNRKYAVCLCDCGNTKDIRVSSILSGDSKSCGCLLKIFLKDLTGQRFGKLTVIKRVEDRILPSRQHKTQWLCQCDCGNTCVVTSTALIQGKTKSCGCLIHEQPFKDLIGQRFGKLTVIKLDHIDHFLGYNKHYWLCQCDCGNNCIVESSSLIYGHTKSCGCLLMNFISNLTKTHGLRKHRLYNIHHNMKRRCYDIKDKSYKNYGGRGITICDEWLDKENGFMNFYNWSMSNGYDENAKYGECTIDRINNDGNYEPSNCRWVDMKTQANNKRKTK